MKKKAKTIQTAWLFLYGTALIALGIIVIINGEFLVAPAGITGGIFIAVNGVHRIANWFADKNRLKLLSGAANLLIGVITALTPFVTLALLMLVFALYVLLNGIVKLIDFISALKDQTSGAFVSLVSSVFFFTFSVIMIFGSFYEPIALVILTGIYSILYGLSELRLFLRQALPSKAKVAVRRRVRVSIPLFISAFVPLGVLKKYRRRLDSREIDITGLLAEESVDKKGEAPNIHVLIHVSDDGVGIMGHCDLVLDGRVISYGNYDEASSRLFGGLGDGVVFEADFKRYVAFGVKHDNQMIFDYGLKLSHEQMKKIRRAMKKLAKNIYPWQSPLEKARMKNKNAEADSFKDYCSKLWNGTRATFYKFKSGKFKTYFVMSTNCVLLADTILSKAGITGVMSNGIISPGAYYDFLQREYLLENGIAVSRHIYCKDNIDEAADVNTDN